MDEGKKKSLCCNNSWQNQQKAHSTGMHPHFFPSFYQKNGGMTMNKKMNLISLSLAIGILIGFAPNVVRVLTLVGVISILWNQWDEYCVNGRGKG